MLNAGDRFPEFALKNQDGVVRRNADYAGKWLVVYAYPKDDTPGCTIQGKGFTAAKADYDAASIQAVGLSADDVDSHKAFCNKFSFTHELLADPEAVLLAKTGIAQSEWKGMKFWDRTTWVVDPKGIVRKVYEKVSPEGHEAAVLADIKALG